MNDDNIIEYYNQYCNTHKKISRIILDLNIEYKEYLKNRFDDSNSILESLYRIISNNIKRPTCKICGKKVRFRNIANGFNDYCSTKCSMSDPKTIEKLQKTFIKNMNIHGFLKLMNIKIKLNKHH